MKTNIAVIGTGYWGKNLVRNFHELGALRCICDKNQAVGETFKAKYPDVQIHTDLQQVLNDKTIGAVAIATPAVTHYEIATSAMEAGKDVFVEKPLAITVDQGERLVKLAESHKRVLMIGHILRYHPAVVKLKELIDTGELGRIQYLYSNRLNMGKIRTEENILWSFAPHDVSVMLALLNEMPESVACQGGAYLDKNVPDVTMSQFAFKSGVQAHIFVSWLHPFKEQRLVVVGARQMAVFDDTAENKLLLYPHAVEWKNRIPTAVKADAVIVKLGNAEPLKEECRHFIECTISRAAPVTDGIEGLSVLKVLDACERSLRQAGCSIACCKADEAKTAFFTHTTAFVDEGAIVGKGTKVWHFSHVMKGAKIGERCILGQNVNIDGGTVLGNNVKIQNNVSVYTGTVIEDDVFLGPSCVLTNVTNPRSQINRHSLYENTTLKRGCSVGANATIVCGVTIGRYAFVGAGAVVTKDVPDYALVVGNPGRQKGWMSRHGHVLKIKDADGNWICPESGFRYKETAPGIVKCLDLDEEAILPENLAKGAKTYDEFKKEM